MRPLWPKILREQCAFFVALGNLCKQSLHTETTHLIENKHSNVCMVMMMMAMHIASVLDDNNNELHAALNVLNCLLTKYHE